jgi:hypothetical protein
MRILVFGAVRLNRRDRPSTTEARLEPECGVPRNMTPWVQSYIRCMLGSGLVLAASNVFDHKQWSMGVISVFSVWNRAESRHETYIGTNQAA